MSEPFLAEVRIFAGNFAPRGWAFCNGQLLPIAQNTALFSLIGTTYGGDGRTTTALPNLEGRAPMHPGRGPGLTARRLGEKVGTSTVTLTEAQIPAHKHLVEGNNGQGITSDPTGHNFGVEQQGGGGGAQRVYTDDLTTLVQFNAAAVTHTGGGQAHNNVQPYLGLNFIIALVGLYPSRS